MDILLDTHIFIWWDEGSTRLSRATMAMIATPTNRVFVSAASNWEIAIKRRTGKLSFSGSPGHAVTANSFVELVISGADCELAGNLDWIHNDPFDRMIIAQAQARGMTLITADANMQKFIGVAIVAAT